MFQWALKKVFGTKHEREIKRLRPIVDAINLLEPACQKLSDDQLKAKTAEFKEKLSRGASLEDIRLDAFAVLREASKRALGMRHYDVQLIGGMVLHEGKIAEMKTGEGKTLVATLPCYLNALEGKGVHVVTVNDYLAKRDAEWMGRLYGWMGMSTGVVVPQQRDGAKKRAYRCDITYGQNNEFGFDYLRDNMKFSIYDYAQRPLNFAIVDEVDSILVDEARTPLIISGPGETASDKYTLISDMIPQPAQGRALRRRREGPLGHAHRGRHRPGRRSCCVPSGVTKIENLYEPVNLESLHILNQCLRAHTLYKRDQQYMVTTTARSSSSTSSPAARSPGRRWSDGLHQAVEAKEHVPIQDESRTLATISFQNLFRLYKKLVGHDRHGRHRGRRVPEDLQPRRGGHPDQPQHPARRLRRPRLQDREARSSKRWCKRHRGVPQPRPAGAGRHHQRREVRGAVAPAREEGHPAQRAQRQAARARGLRGRAGRPQGRASRSPPTWPVAVPTSCSAATRR